MGYGSLAILAFGANGLQIIERPDESVNINMIMLRTYSVGRGMLRHARALGITFALPDNLLAKLDKAAARQHLSRSAMDAAA
jgi:hypothetical protein